MYHSVFFNLVSCILSGQVPRDLGKDLNDSAVWERSLYVGELKSFEQWESLSLLCCWFIALMLQRI